MADIVNGTVSNSASGVVVRYESVFDSDDDDPSCSVTLLIERLYQVGSGSDATLLVSSMSSYSSGLVSCVSGGSGGGSFRLSGGGADPTPTPVSFLDRPDYEGSVVAARVWPVLVLLRIVLL